VQQTFALGALIGIITHADAMDILCRWFFRYTCQRTLGFLAAHPYLYRATKYIRLFVHNGKLLTGSLTSPCFVHGVHPACRVVAT